MKKKLLFIVFAALFIVAIFNIQVNAEDEFTITDQSVDVKFNATKYLHTTGSGPITWESDDSTIASVDNGTVTGNKIGKTNIKATREGKTATCEVNVVYNAIIIGGNEHETVSNVNLIIGEHSTEQLTSKVEDGTSEEVPDAVVTWTSDAPNTVSVDRTTGLITAIKPGEATITASVEGATDTCKVTVYNGPEFTDFSQAQYEIMLEDTDEILQIKGIQPQDNNNYYYYIITPNQTRPNVITNSMRIYKL